MNLNPRRWDDTLEDELIDLRSGEQVFMTIRPKLIRAWYTTLDVQKGSGIRFFCPPLKGVDSKTQKSDEVDLDAKQIPGLSTRTGC